MFELELAASITHPGIVCARDMFMVWVSPKELLGSTNCVDFDDPEEERLLLVQEMDFIDGDTVADMLQEVGWT